MQLSEDYLGWSDLIWSIQLTIDDDNDDCHNDDDNNGDDDNGL